MDIIERKEWGAPTNPGGSYRNLDVIDKMVFHWTTGTTLGESNQKQWVKNIYEYHTGSNGWSDIGYNFLVDRYGNIYEGRGLYRRGAHAPNANLSGVGVALLGGNSDALTAEAKRAVNELVDWVEGKTGNLSEHGHRDIPGNSTTCPGNAFHSWVHNGLPNPDGSEGDPDDGQPNDKDKIVVAVVANNDIDEGMARVLGSTYRWKFIHADDVSRYQIGTAVRVGAARSMDGPWDETHDIGGSTRQGTALEVARRILEREGDSRSVT